MYVKGQLAASSSRPLGDKTPFANRSHAGPTPHVPRESKLILMTPAPQKPDTSLLRPSSARKHIRAPRPSYETPTTNGKHWDVSDIDIDVEGVGAESKSATIEEEDYDEIEYMAPTAIGKSIILRLSRVVRLTTVLLRASI